MNPIALPKKSVPDWVALSDILNQADPEPVTVLDVSPVEVSRFKTWSRATLDTAIYSRTKAPGLPPGAVQFALSPLSSRGVRRNPVEAAAADVESLGLSPDGAKLMLEVDAAKPAPTDPEQVAAAKAREEALQAIANRDLVRSAMARNRERDEALKAAQAITDREAVVARMAYEVADRAATKANADRIRELQRAHIMASAEGPEAEAQAAAALQAFKVHCTSPEVAAAAAARDLAHAPAALALALAATVPAPAAPAPSQPRRVVTYTEPAPEFEDDLT